MVLNMELNLVYELDHMKEYELETRLEMNLGYRVVFLKGLWRVSMKALYLVSNLAGKMEMLMDLRLECQKALM